MKDPDQKPDERDFPFLEIDDLASGSAAPRAKADDLDAPMPGRGDDVGGKSAEEEKQAPLHLAVATSCLLALILALFLRAFVAQAYEIRGKSMEPTLHDGEKVMISKLSPTIQPVNRGDLVIFTSPRDARKDLIKRVVAVAGDQIEFRDGKLIINGVALDESYIHHDLFPRAISPGRIRSPVPPDHIVVLGDNRPNSQDSRHFGPIPLSQVRGKVFLRWWPISEATTFP